MPEKGLIRHPQKDFLIELSARRHKRALQSLLATPPPPTWDSVSLGWVGPIKDQRQCGSCWDFSGTGMVEVAYNKAGVGGGPATFVLSEEYVMSCHRTGACNGDDNVTVLDIAKSTGLPLTSDYGPYTSGPKQCLFKPQMTLYKVDDWGFADGSGGNGVAPTDAIKAAIMQYGCVGAAIAADDAFLNANGSKVFDSTTSHSIDHDIILVGWDDSKGRNGAWRLRNSWNTGWGDNGYLWIGYGVNLVGTEAVWCRINAAAPPIDYYV